MSTGNGGQPIDLTADWLSSAIAIQNNANYLNAGSVLAYLQGQVGPLGPPILTLEQAIAIWDEYIRELKDFLAECQRRRIPIEGTPPEMRGIPGPGTGPESGSGDIA